MVNSLCPHPPPSTVHCVAQSLLPQSPKTETSPSVRQPLLVVLLHINRAASWSFLDYLWIGHVLVKTDNPPPSFKITDIYSLLLTSFHGFIRRDEFIMSPFLCNHASVCINGTGFGKTNTGVGLFTQTETHFVWREHSFPFVLLWGIFSFETRSARGALKGNEPSESTSSCVQFRLFWYDLHEDC